MTTPDANIPTKSRPIAVSADNLDFLVIQVIPAIITSEPTEAPTNPGIPQSNAEATPGSTPWANASPRKANPLSTMKVPTIPHAMATRVPAKRAFSKNPLFKNGVINISTYFKLPVIVAVRFFIMVK